MGCGSRGGRDWCEGMGFKRPFGWMRERGEKKSVKKWEEAGLCLCEEEGWRVAGACRAAMGGGR